MLLAEALGMTQTEHEAGRPWPAARWAAMLVAAVGAGLLMALWAAGSLQPAPALAAAVVLGVSAMAAASWSSARASRGQEPRSIVADPIPPDESGAPYGLVLESLPDPVIVAAAGSEESAAAARLLFANGAARQLFRAPRPGVLLGAVIRHPEVLEALEEALYGGIEAEASFEDSGSLDRFWRVVARPLESGDSRRLAVLWMRDETDARRNERMRADFLANASHELRTPLASLSGFIETLRGHAKDDAGARDRFLAIMAQQADRMTRLVADLLSLSRIELNEHIPPSEEVDLCLAVTEVIDGLGPLAAGQGPRLEARLPPSSEAIVIGDRDQIIQVIQNLVDNAMKYAGDGGAVTIEVRGDVLPEEPSLPPSGGAARLSLLAPDRGPRRHFAALRVSDTGPGIAREHLTRLSERFYRVEGQKSGERSGTGLGLAIVKHIVNRHRGGLSVESTPGQGSTFTAYFPMA